MMWGEGKTLVPGVVTLLLLNNVYIGGGGCLRSHRAKDPLIMMWGEGKSLVSGGVTLLLLNYVYIGGGGCLRSHKAKDPRP